MAEELMDQQKRYLSYLLRMWQEDSGSPPLWRASLERPQTGERLGFASLVDLFIFLENETRSTPPGSQPPEEEKR
jgi:hypothetical protein